MSWTFFCIFFFSHYIYILFISFEIMSNVLQIPTDKTDLINQSQGFADYQYVEVQPLRSVSDDVVAGTYRFSDGAIDLRWSMADDEYWIPNRSYIRFRMVLTRVDDNQLFTSDDISPSMNIASTLFNRITYKINNQVVSELSENIPQIDSLQCRLRKSADWLDTVGNDVSFFNESFERRQNRVVVDPVDFNPVTTAPYPVAAALEDLLDDEPYGNKLLRLANPNQVTFIAIAGAVPGTITFTVNGGAAIPDMRILFPVGSQIIFDDGARKVQNVIGHPDPASIYVDGVVTAVAAANFANQVYHTAPDRVFSLRDKRSKTVTEFEVCWQPPISVFKLKHALPGSARHELEFSVLNGTSYRKSAIESLLADKIPHPTAGANYKFGITDMKLYLCKFRGPRLTDGPLYLDLEETRCQKLSITTIAPTQTAFTVEPSTYALTLAFQDTRSGTNTLFPLTKFRMGSDTEQFEQNLKRYYIRYGNTQKRQPDAELNNFGNTINNMTDLFYRNLIYNNHFFGGAQETFEQWRNRGLYIHHPWPKTGTDKSTQGYLLQEFEGGIGNGDSQKILLFDHYRKVALIEIVEGMVDRVLVNNV